MYEDVCYKHPYLTEVVIRVDFAAPITKFEKSLPPKLVQSLARAFPIVEPVNAVGFQFQIGADNTSKGGTRTIQWHLYGREREKQLGLSSTFMFARYTQYTTYEDMKAEFIGAVDAIEKEQPGTIVQRIGLRYVNRFDIAGIGLRDWGKFISAQLLGTLEFFEHGDQLTRLFHIAELKCGDIDTRFQFGFPNDDFPAIIKRPVFILDIDAYMQIAHQLTESATHMETAHVKIQHLFERSITNELRSKMNA